MRAIIQIIFLLCLFYGPYYSVVIIRPVVASIKLKGPGTKTSHDFDAVMRFVRNGNKLLSSKGSGIDNVKACIDSASLICEKKKLDVPADLYLLEAEYFFATGDLRSASEKAALALDVAEETKNREALAKTFLFLGKYNRRTGFFKESIDNYENAIAIADRENLRGIIPLACLEQAFLYGSVEDHNREIEYFERFIDASNSESDTSLAISGYAEIPRLWPGGISEEQTHCFVSVTIWLQLKKTLFFARGRLQTGDGISTWRKCTIPPFIATKIPLSATVFRGGSTACLQMHWGTWAPCTVTLINQRKRFSITRKQ